MQTRARVGFELTAAKRLQKALHLESPPVGIDYCVRCPEAWPLMFEDSFHFCIVMDLHAKSIADLLRAEITENGRPPIFSLTAVKNLSRQVFLAASCLHSLGFIHTGLVAIRAFDKYQSNPVVDIKTTNIYLDLVNHDPEAVADFLRKHPPQTYPLRRTDAENCTVKSQPIPCLGEVSLETVKISLGDYGEGIYASFRS